MLNSAIRRGVRHVDPHLVHDVWNGLHGGGQQLEEQKIKTSITLEKYQNILKVLKEYTGKITEIRQKEIITTCKAVKTMIEEVKSIIETCDFFIGTGIKLPSQVRKKQTECRSLLEAATPTGSVSTLSLEQITQVINAKINQITVTIGQIQENQEITDTAGNIIKTLKKRLRQQDFWKEDVFKQELVTNINALEEKIREQLTTQITEEWTSVMDTQSNREWGSAKPEDSLVPVLPVPNLDLRNKNIDIVAALDTYLTTLKENIDTLQIEIIATESTLTQIENEINAINSEDVGSAFPDMCTIL